jgi:hypothetical protein
MQDFSTPQRDLEYDQRASTSMDWSPPLCRNLFAAHPLVARKPAERQPAAGGFVTTHETKEHDYVLGSFRNLNLG